MWSHFLLFTSCILRLAKSAAADDRCAADKIPKPQYFGTEILNIEAKEIRGYEQWFFIDHLNVPFERKPINFCNVTLSYTHPGLGDTVNVYVWLPLENYNGNFFGVGGGGFAAGHEGALAPTVALGYASANTDAGHSFLRVPESMMDANFWALASPGNVNWALLQDFAATALDDVTHLAKAVTQSFYGKPPKYSYWNGCSTGGRQGLLQAQRYPRNYNGILAAAPAINWASLTVVGLWGQILMKRENYYPPQCEFEAIRKAAIQACDEIDGVKDGLIAAPGLCHFDAKSIVGKQFDCHGDIRKISQSAAKIVNAAWEGPKRDGKFEWFGITHETPMCNGASGGLLNTVCDGMNQNCKPIPMPICASWVRLFLAKNPEYDVNKMTEDDFFAFLHQSRQQYTSIISTDDPDLSAFREAGGKMITWHGLADELIYPNGTSDYYERVLALDPKAHDFYRFFEAPGVGHCDGGVGAYPSQALTSLIDWVEKGKVPEVLEAATVPKGRATAVKHRPLCPYPKVAAYIGGPPDDASSFKCADKFGTRKANFREEHSEL